MTSKLHNKLTGQHHHYKKWHESKHHAHIHWLAFIIYASLVSLGLGYIFINPESTWAASNYYVHNQIIDEQGNTMPFRKYTLSSSADSTLADGQSGITITAGAFSLAKWDDATSQFISTAPTPDCIDGQTLSGLDIKIVVSGSGNTLTPSRGPISCNTGLANFTLKSTTAETKTIKLYQECKAHDPWCYFNTDIKVTFTSPATKNNTGSSATNTSTSTTKTTATTVVTTETENKNDDKKEQILLSTINGEPFNNQEMTTLEQKKRFTLSGKTFPNAKIKLYIYSEPFTAETTSDDTGYWEYQVTKELEPGEHRIEAEVTKEDGTTTEKTEIAKFRIAAVAITEVEQPNTDTAAKEGANWFYWGLAGAGVLLAGTLGFFLYLKKKKHPKQ